MSGRFDHLRLWTIGHSTRSEEEFLALLKEAGIATLVDVRRFPGSRKFPHFNRDALAASLTAVGVAYQHAVELGGRRKPSPDSHNTAWRNDSFRAYADYMETQEFAEAAEALAETTRASNTSVMCSEAVWWRCHRGLIADYFKAEGAEVLHIVGRGKIEPHPFTSAAKLVDGRLSYAAPPDDDAAQSGMLF
jgi:uncharacterized protein (DUF488 family)